MSSHLHINFLLHSSLQFIPIFVLFFTWLNLEQINTFCWTSFEIEYNKTNYKYFFEVQLLVPCYYCVLFSFWTLSFCSSTSDFCSLFPSHRVTEHIHLRWPLTSAQYSESETSQSQANISCTMGRQDDPAEQSRLPAQTSNTPTPVRSLDGSDMIPFVMSSAPVWTRPGHTSPDPGTAGSELSVRRHRLSLCLPSCLQTDDTWWVFVRSKKCSHYCWSSLHLITLVGEMFFSLCGLNQGWRHFCYVKKIKSGEYTDGYGMFIWIYQHYGVCIESAAPSAVCKEKCGDGRHLTPTFLLTRRDPA